jgi:hypothetical protein
MVLNLREFRSGLGVWRNRTTWNQALHNDLYTWLAGINPRGDFNVTWWAQVAPVLARWKALRPFGVDEMTKRFAAHEEGLSRAWLASCSTIKPADTIATVEWDTVGRFTAEVAKLKPTAKPSAVFTSKFSHFALPSVFPVVDNDALKGWGRNGYSDYYRCARDEWLHTPEHTQQDLRRELIQHLCNATAGNVFPSFPQETKIIELCLMGRR